MPINVVFVCLGNICRSPMAEAVFQQMVDEAGLSEHISVDSAGTGGWIHGEPAHRGTRRVLKRNGINYAGQARQLSMNDLETANYLIAMDSSNLNNIKRLGSTTSEVRLLLDYADESRETEVPDPYYDGRFAYVYELVTAGSRGLLAAIRTQHGI